MPENPDFTYSDTWRIFRIMSEFVEGFETMSHIGPGVSIFGSARTPEDHVNYDEKTENYLKDLSQNSKSPVVQEFAKNERVDIRFYDVIYHALDDIRLAMIGMLDPTFVERVLGHLEVREIFSVPKVGTVAGCYVTDGKIERHYGKVQTVQDGR